MRYLGLLLLIMSVSLNARADETRFDGGADIGGGLGLVCFETQRAADHVFHQNGKISDEYISQIVNVTPIDLVDASMNAPIESRMVFANRNENHDQYTDRLLKSIGHLFPEFAGKVKQVKGKLKNVFVKESLPLMFDAELPDDWNTNDRCTVVTLAVQNRSRVTIDQRLFQKMNATERGVLMLHEYVYYHGRQTRGHQTSRATRKLLRNLLYDNLNKRRDETARQLIELGFTTTH